MIDKIYDLLEHMEEELEDAEEYASKAIECAKHSSSNKTMYISMADDELGHFEKLLEMLKSQTDIGEEMKYFIDKKHVSMLKKHSFIKHLIQKAKE